MLFKLSELNSKNLSQLKDLFYAIPNNETTLVYKIDDHQVSYKLLKSMTFLPRHLTSIKFSGFFSYTRIPPYQVIEGTRIEPISVVDGTRIIRAAPLNGREIPNLINVYYFKRQLNRVLKLLLAAIPESIHRVHINLERYTSYEFRGNRRIRTIKSDVSADFEDLFKTLPGNVDYLDISHTDLREETEPLLKIIGAIPITVNQIKIGCLNLIQRSISDRRAIYSALNSELKSLNLTNNELGAVAAPYEDFFEGLPINLMELNIGNNNLFDRESNKLRTIIQSLPKNLIHLILSGNSLSRFPASDLAIIFSYLPKTLMTIDLSNNEFINMSIHDFNMVLSGLPPGVKKISLGEKSLTTQSLSRFKEQLAFSIPKTIKSIHLTMSSMSDCIQLLDCLPDTIHTLDLSGNDLYSRTPDELSVVLSHLKPNINSLVLNDNSLSCLTIQALKIIFYSLPKTVAAISLLNNGFDRLLHTQLNELLDGFPDLSLSLETRQLGIRNDGALTLHPSRPQYGFFKPIGAIRHQKVSAGILLNLAHLMSQKRLNPQIMCIIASLMVERTSLPHIQQLVGKIDAMSSLIPTKSLGKITNTTTRECQDNIETRIKRLSPGDTTLNLSHCGLNHINQDIVLKAIFRSIPKKIHSLNLRSNGFSLTDAHRTIFINALAGLESNIKYINLSQNGFECEDAQGLTELFSKLPSTVEWISLSNESPASPSDHIASRRWPGAYRQLVSKSDDMLMQSRLILDNYTLGNSALRRFFYGHWNRHHIQAVSKIVDDIDRGYLTNISDVLNELERIKAFNTQGSLRRRIAFLFNAVDSQRTEQIEEAEQVDDLETRAMIRRV